jgi:Uma2 family endonuclease
MSQPARPLVTVDALDRLEDVHAEVIAGELVVETMTTFEHSDAQASLATEIKRHFRGSGPDGKGGWWIGTEVTVLYAQREGFRHDVAGWRKERVPVRPSGARVDILPDWVCEVLSTNRRKDLVHKRHVLHEKGVRHYWIVDPDARTLEILRHGPDGYVVVTTVTPGMHARLEPFDAVELDVTLLFGDVEADDDASAR